MPVEFARAYVLRVTIVWLAIRTFVVGVGQSPWSAQALAIAVAGTVVIILVDAEARHERRHLANLGVGRRVVMAVCFVTIVLIEGLIRAVSRGVIGG